MTEVIPGTFSSSADFTSPFQNNFSIQDSQPPSQIRSVQLYPGENRAGMPAIVLGGNNTLTLRFDQLGTRPDMFRVRFTHHNSDWSVSNLIPGFYIRGQESDVIVENEPSNVQNPAYSHFEYTFPNRNIRFLVSGNYMIHIHDYNSDERLFSLPFLLHEERGAISTEIESLYPTQGPSLLMHQVFSEYHYPNFVNMPNIDLEVFFVQNQFLGRKKLADQTDMSRAGVFRTHITRENAFPGRYEFRQLHINRLGTDTRNVLEFRPETIPPRVILDRDIVNLNVQPRSERQNRFGSPRNDTEARYASVHFELEVPYRELDTEADIFLVGPFNNWNISERNRMQFSDEIGRFTGSALVKEGIYDYKYVVLEDGIIDDLRLDASFADSRQEYAVLVYYRDPQEQFDRLLHYYSFHTQ